MSKNPLDLSGRSPEARTPRCLFSRDASASGRGVGDACATVRGLSPSQRPHGPGRPRSLPSRRCHHIVRVDFRPAMALTVIISPPGGPSITFLRESKLRSDRRLLRANVETNLTEFTGCAPPLFTPTESFPRKRESPFAKRAVQSRPGRAGRRPPAHSVTTDGAANRDSRFRGNDPVGGLGVGERCRALDLIPGGGAARWCTNIRPI